MFTDPTAASSPECNPAGTVPAPMSSLTRTSILWTLSDEQKASDQGFSLASVDQLPKEEGAKSLLQYEYGTVRREAWPLALD